MRPPSLEELKDEFNLTLKQARFVQELPGCDWHQEEAANLAGYSPASARTMAYRNMQNPKIQAAIDAFSAPLAKRAEVRAEDLIEEYRRLAFSNIADVVEWDDEGKVVVRPSSELPREITAAIKKIKSKTVTKTFDDYTDTTTYLEIEFHSKEKAMDKLGQYLGLWNDPNELREQLLAFFARMSPEQLKEIEGKPDDEVIRLIEENGVWRMPDAAGS